MSILTTDISAQTPPGQPSYGSGGNNYIHASYDSTFYGNDITDMYWLFEPQAPQPDSAPVVVVWHGMTMMMDSTQVINMHLSLVKHLARKGYNVIYPLYQYGGNTLSPYSYQRDVCAAIVDSALARLDDGTHVHPKRDSNGEMLLATTGYSKGGAMSITMASSYWMYGLPKFRAVADFVSFDANANTDSIPSDTKLLVVLGDNDANIESFIAVDTVISRFYDLTHIPCQNRHLLMVNSDSTGSPPLTADHHFYVANPNNPSSVNALDFFGSWKLVTSLLDCAFFSTNCEYCLSDSDSIAFMGKWSNSVPVAPITIMDTCSSVGINNYMSKYLTLKIYPNPANQNATLEFDNSGQENHTLTLYDTQGRLVKTLTNITADQITIDTDDLTSGLYFFQLSTGGQVRFKGKLTIE